MSLRIILLTITYTTMKNILFLLLALLPLSLWGVCHDVPRDSIILSDPCILADSASQT